MQNTFKVGDKIKVVKFSTNPPERYFKYIGQVFTVVDVDVVDFGAAGTYTIDPEYDSTYLCFYNNEIELVKDEPAPQEVVSPSQVSQSQEVVPTPKKSIAWAVVNKATGKVEWIRQPRRVARKLAKFQNETSNHVYQVKKIEYEFV